MAEQKLETFVEGICGTNHLRVEADLGGGFVRLRTSEADRRQAAQDIRASEDVVIEMLRNSRDAGAKNIFLASSREANTRRFVVVDDGCGVPETMRQLIFEPRVTSKLDTFHTDKWGVHGRGMALYSISVNTQIAKVVASGSGLGSAFVIESNISSLPEKTDQSTFPTFELAGEGNVVVRGPKNILRTTCEFAIESHNTCNVYIGSMVDVASTLYEYGFKHAAKSPVNTREAEGELPLCMRLAKTRTPEAFAKVAHSLGLEMSSRSARRIMDGEITPLCALVDKIEIQGINNGETDARHTPKIINKTKAKPVALKLSAADKTQVKKGAKKLYSKLAQSYYLNANVDPDISVTGGKLRIEIPIVNQD